MKEYQDTNIPVIKMWNTITGSKVDNERRLHSRNCNVILNLCHNYKTSVCNSCSKDIDQLERQCVKKLTDTSSDECLPKCLEAEETDSSVELTTSDHEDLITIIRKLIPNAPKFEILLHSQLRNANDIECRRRRWDPKMISLCLNLWAKSPNAYSDLAVFHLFAPVRLPRPRVLTTVAPPSFFFSRSRLRFNRLPTLPGTVNDAIGTSPVMSYGARNYVTAPFRTL